MCVGPRCPAAALSLTCVPVLGGSTDFTVLFNHGQVTWAPSGLSWLCGHRSKRELGLAMSLQHQGKDRALGSALAWPGAAGTHRGVQSCHSQRRAGTSSPAGTLFPCQPHPRRNPGSWSCLETGNCIPGDFAGNGLGRCHPGRAAGAAVLPPAGQTKEPLLPCSPLEMAVMRKRIWSGSFHPSQHWTDRAGVAASPGLSVLGDTWWPSHADPEMSHTSMARAGSLGPGMLLLIKFATNYTQGL